MSTAVPTPVTSAPQPVSDRTSLFLASFFGAAVVLGGLFVAGYVVPTYWDQLVAPFLDKGSGFINVALRLVGQIVAAAVVIWLGTRLAGTNPPKGLRGGIFLVISVLLTVFFLVRALGLNLEGYQSGMMITAGVGAVITFFLIRFLFGNRAQRYMRDIEHAGWFHTHSYKHTQGILMRRLTQVGVWIIGISGVWSISVHNMIPTDPATGNVTLSLPFTLHDQPIADDSKTAESEKPAEENKPAQRSDIPQEHLHLPLLPSAPVAVILLGVGVIWFGWRLVNVPAFADFLINTEAEMNKVSWSSKKRLAQDTVIVLVTVLLLTVFLLLIDLFWGWLLSREVIRVLPPHKATEGVNQNDTPKW